MKSSHFNLRKRIGRVLVSKLRIGHLVDKDKSQKEQIHESNHPIPDTHHAIRMDVVEIIDADGDMEEHNRSQSRIIHPAELDRSHNPMHDKQYDSKQDWC